PLGSVMLTAPKQTTGGGPPEPGPRRGSAAAGRPVADDQVGVAGGAVVPDHPSAVTGGGQVLVAAVAGEALQFPARHRDLEQFGQVAVARRQPRLDVDR